MFEEIFGEHSCNTLYRTPLQYLTTFCFTALFSTLFEKTCSQILFAPLLSIISLHMWFHEDQADYHSYDHVFNRSRCVRMIP